jgi:hypothetical protein
VPVGACAAREGGDGLVLYCGKTQMTMMSRSSADVVAPVSGPLRVCKRGLQRAELPRQCGSEPNVCQRRRYCDGDTSTLPASAGEVAQTLPDAMRHGQWLSGGPMRRAYREAKTQRATSATCGKRMMDTTAIIAPTNCAA